jgi:four helix bundle protein
MARRAQFRFEKLKVWHAARAFAREVYGATRSFPKDELFGLTSQLRRASTSISSNIAEGSGRNSDADYAHFLEIAYGSAMETASLLFIAGDVGHLTETERDRLLDLVAEISPQINALHASLDVPRSAKTPFKQSRGAEQSRSREAPNPTPSRRQPL